MRSDESIREFMKELVKYIIEASNLYEITRKSILQEKPKGKIVVAFGKASIPMAKAAVEVLGEKVEGGVVVIPKWRKPEKIDGLEVLQASHPIPDESSLKAGEVVVEWARASKGKGLLALISGGGSALVEKLQPGLTLDDLKETTKQLLYSGANIHEINTIRKHLSMIKGGWLAKHASPGPVYGYYASDVPGDKLESIASGPTVPDPTTYEDALKIIEKYKLRDRIPARVLALLEDGVRGHLPETPKPDDQVFKNVTNRLIAANIDVLKRLSHVLRQNGYNTLILTSRLDGESREVGRVLASIGLEIQDKKTPLPPPAAILLGGETTVTVRNPEGRGGRNQELALSWLVSVDYWMPKKGSMGLLAMDTDGIDGNSDAAGAIVVAGDTLDLRSKGIDPSKYLEKNDSYQALKSIGGLVVTGPLDSNLNSVIIMLVRDVPH